MQHSFCHSNRHSSWGRVERQDASRGRRQTICLSSSKDSSKDDGKANARKADFAAYWSLKIKELFANMRKYIEESERRGMPTPDLVKSLDAQADEKRKQLLALEMQEMELDQIRKEESKRTDAAKVAQVEAMLSANPMFGKDDRVRMSPEEEDLVAEEDIDRARKSVRAASIYGLALNLQRSRDLIRAVLLLPLNILTWISQQWRATFNSQRYENFLMAEGERIWYWRNRTENERWFWEIILIERFIIPVVCAISYEYLVPNNFIWAVVVPLTLIFLQSGTLPGIGNIEFWLIAYLGLWKKCLEPSNLVAAIRGRLSHRTQTKAKNSPTLLIRPPRLPCRLVANAVNKDEDEQNSGKSIDVVGAGQTWSSPGWLTQLNMLWTGKGTIPVANAKPDDIKDLLGGALFQALYKWMQESGPVYLLPTGPVSSFLVISDPAAAKHVLRSTDNSTRNLYDKGLVAEVSQFLFGDGFAIAGGDLWKARRRAVGPSLHRAYLEEMLDRVFGESSLFAAQKLEASAAAGQAVNMESIFSQLTLDIIGKSVFNYDFNSLTTDSPLIQAVYTSLKETETRATDLLPYWKIPFLCKIVPRQQKALAAVELIRKTTSDLIKKCKEMVDEEEMAAAAAAGEEYMNRSDPSVLRFLIAAREEVESTQLRDDLLSMLVAGHETTGSALTWTLYLLATNPEKMKAAQEEVDRVLGSRVKPTMADYGNLRYIMRCVNESMRLYPHPPVLLRRALVADTLPGGYDVVKGQDVMISVYNIHHSDKVWDRPDEFIPERFGPLDGPVPNEQNTDFRYIPFSGGPRKCVGDQFALMEAVIAMTVLLRQFDFSLVPNQTISMTTGATIHTTNGLYMNVKKREMVSASPSKQPVGAAA